MYFDVHIHVYAPSVCSHVLPPPAVQLYAGETLGLMLQRWSKLEKVYMSSTSSMFTKHCHMNVHMCRAELMVSPCRISRGQMASLTSVKFQIYMTVSNMISYTTGSGLVYTCMYMYIVCVQILVYHPFSSSFCYMRRFVIGL